MGTGWKRKLSTGNAAVGETRTQRGTGSMDDIKVLP